MITLPSEIATSAGMFVLAIVQALILLALAPLFSGISRMIRARIQSRRGPGVLQDYRDIAKLMKRQNIWPDNAGAVSRIMPYVLISTVMVVAMSLPLFTCVSPFGAGSDLITVIYLFALFRFFFSIAGLDSNSTFSSLGASREVTLGVLVEPILMLAFLVIALIAGSTNFAVIGTQLADQSWQYPIATVVALVAAFFAVFIEMGKIPFDLAEAEQELQEGPLTEYSGPSLALLKIGLSLKSMVVAAIFVSVLLPFGSAQDFSISAVVFGAVFFFVKLLVVFVLACVFENTLSRTRFMLTGRLTVVGFGISVLAFVFYFTGL
ncbi:respiratory chain complex I subunit 1 family protein [Aggregatibacter actinomycetemcomitans]|uniref:respiratory chain complex I subunit 1 family protein n=1 Tax=Aggregatibacter actinomycetemcomitans TaxID=714 RepID=UPI0011D9F3A5|nr:respiratory chain complex I subunit 1 family protein [Aggregatibacter actinomycetemcomitans]TYA51126.1 respiratory chain complex I subunit 1 family protein [Aggregatibacter actinomycetemcomitans]TYB29287.1 respiratory chain complex I subunit 1 family protein [Aggregatibacter actinomycetemcomitans]